LNTPNTSRQRSFLFWDDTTETLRQSQESQGESQGELENSSQDSGTTTLDKNIQRCSREDRIRVQTLIQFGIKYKEIMAGLELTLGQVRYAAKH
jgi:hypothetical protein